MGMATSLLLSAAAAAQAGVHELPDHSASKPSIALQSTATVRILAGAQIRFGRVESTAKVNSKSPPQVHRDASGRLWVEFS